MTRSPVDNSPGYVPGPGEERAGVADTGNTGGRGRRRPSESSGDFIGRPGTRGRETCARARARADMGTPKGLTDGGGAYVSPGLDAARMMDYFTLRPGVPPHTRAIDFVCSLDAAAAAAAEI